VAKTLRSFRNLHPLLILRHVTFMLAIHLAFRFRLHSTRRV